MMLHSKICTISDRTSAQPMKGTSGTHFSAENPNQYKEHCKATGLCKPTLFSGLIMLGVPGIFTMDLMHLSVLNDPNLLLGLW